MTEQKLAPEPKPQSFQCDDCEETVGQAYEDTDGAMVCMTCLSFRQEIALEYHEDPEELNENG